MDSSRDQKEKHRLCFRGRLRVRTLKSLLSWVRPSLPGDLPPGPGQAARPHHSREPKKKVDLSKGGEYTNRKQGYPHGNKSCAKDLRWTGTGEGKKAGCGGYLRGGGGGGGWRCRQAAHAGSDSCPSKNRRGRRKIPIKRVLLSIQKGLKRCGRGR